MMKRLLLVLGVALVSGCSLKARPHDIDCSQSTIAEYTVPALRSDLIDQIQRDAGADFATPSQQSGPNKGNVPAFEVESVRIGTDALAGDPIFEALGGTQPKLPDVFHSGPGIKIIKSGNTSRTQWSGLPEQAQTRERKNALLLSGGGEWGAFGAAFLRQLHDAGGDRHLPNFSLVTGVSTGAIQSLYVVAGDFKGLDAQYRDPKPLSVKGGLKSVLETGAISDTQPLRDRLDAALCDKPGHCPMLEAIAQSETTLIIGMVESATGRFVPVNISKLVKATYADKSQSQVDHIKSTANCVLGITLASSAVPVQLRPVRLRDPATGKYHAYSDGGVRLSVFDADIAAKAEAAIESSGQEVSLWVLRNGPTVVRPSKWVDKQAMPAVDAKPSADNIGMMSYSTLVNQNEVMSIASLRLVHKLGEIRVATADGYHTSQNWRTTRLCEKSTWKPTSKTEGEVGNDEDAFDHDFMQCLADFGQQKAEKHPTPWIELGS